MLSYLSPETLVTPVNRVTIVGTYFSVFLTRVGISTYHKWLLYDGVSHICVRVICN
jgi:hypothetical protein